MTTALVKRRTFTWLALGAAATALLWLLSPVLSPFLISAMLAYALCPSVNALVARGLPRALAVMLVVSGSIIVLLALLLLIVPVLSKELPLVQEQVPLLAERLNRNLSPWLAKWGFKISLDTGSIKAFALKYLNSNLEDWAAAALNSARIGGSIAMALLGNAVLVPVVLFYLLLDWHRLVGHVDTMVPPRMRPAYADFMNECDQMLGQYLRGQLLVMLALAVYYSIGLALFRFELALPVGVITGLLVFIPYVGFGIGLFLALLAGVLQFSGWYGLGAVAVVYGFGQLLESFILTPRLVGERIGLNPLMVIFALLAFGHLFGFVGVLIALPVSAVGVVAVRRLRNMYLSSRLYAG